MNLTRRKGAGSPCRDCRRFFCACRCCPCSSVGRSAEADPSPKTARGCAAATALAAEAAAGQLATAACESPLPEEEQARAVAALAARQSTTTATAAADAAAEGGGPAGASAACASVEADAPAAGQLCLGALAEAAASGAAPALAGKVPACVLSRLPAEGGAGSQEATPGPALTAAAPRPSSRSRVRQLAPMQDDGRLPAYSLGLAEEQQPGDKRGRRGDHADEDPALKPVDLFIGVKGLGCCKERGPDPRGNGMLPVCLPHRWWPGLPSSWALPLSGLLQAACRPMQTKWACLMRWCQRGRLWVSNSYGASVTVGTAVGMVRPTAWPALLLTLALPWPCDPACMAGLLPRLLMLRSKGWPWSSVPLSLAECLPS